jgi:nicotinate-nucleotide--dimethylbenzimidazole phosphoribosyltransferase
VDEHVSRILEDIKPLDKKAMEAAKARQDSLTKPQGSLGRLEELAIQIAGIRGKLPPVLEHKAIVTMAADHGVVAEGVSAYPQEVTPGRWCTTFYRAALPSTFWHVILEHG